jgi:phage repressor protein C with HTH and peptisase S24 domain
VNGDSMVPTLEDGDMILVDMSQQQVNREGIYLITTEDGLVTKRLKSDKNAIQVISDNPDYPSWTIDPQNAEQYRVAGKVIWNGRKV